MTIVKTILAHLKELKSLNYNGLLQHQLIQTKYENVFFSAIFFDSDRTLGCLNPMFIYLIVLYLQYWSKTLF